MEKTAIVGGRLIDGTGARPVSDAVILMENNMITSVGKVGNVDVPSDAKVLDVDGKTVMPGLIDSHLHMSGSISDSWAERIVRPEEVALIKAVGDLRALLEAGFTTVKCCGGKIGVWLKMAQKEGTIGGPRLIAAGMVLSQTFGHGDAHYFPLDYAKRLHPTICDGVDECIKATRLALREGADFIKVCTTGGVMSQRDRPEHTQFTLDEIRAIVEEARKVGTYVTSHAQGTEGIMNAIVGGIKTCDHVFYADDECNRLALEKNVVYVPTLSIMRRIIDGGTAAGFPKWGLEKCQEAWEATVKNVAKAQKAGVTMAVGTDFGGSPLMKMGTNALELELLVKNCGYTPMDAIVAATRNGAKARFIGDKTGTLEPGKFADIIVVNGDPLRDIRILQDSSKITTVIKEGKTEVNRGP